MFNTCPHTEIKCTSRPGHITDAVITLNLQKYLFYGKCFSWTSKLTKLFNMQIFSSKGCWEGSYDIYNNFIVLYNFYWCCINKILDRD